MQHDNIYHFLDSIRDSFQARDKRLIDQSKEIRQLNRALADTTLKYKNLSVPYSELQCTYAELEEDRAQDRSVIAHLEHMCEAHNNTVNKCGECIAKQNIEIRELRDKLRKFEVKQDARDMINTTKFYWDCECKTDYIQPRHMMICHVCNARRDSQPDSRLTELTGAQLGMINHQAEQYLPDRR